MAVPQPAHRPRRTLNLGDGSPPALPHGISAVVEALDGVRYGQVRCRIHEGVIVQIDRTTKQRIDRAAPAAATPGVDRPGR